MGPEVARREVAIQRPDGEPVVSDERYFLVQVPDDSRSRADWTAFERELMVEHRWAPARRDRKPP